MRVACKADSSGTLTNQFEQTFFPQFQVILQMDIVEFAPYVFQIHPHILRYKHALSDDYALLPAPCIRLYGSAVAMCQHYLLFYGLSCGWC